ncbi:hypothetical protein U879_05715 [Defluviimonas sp. 20V17]|uniref:HD domain-containing protein n=1 Tax=Allgaiera indica TaxID=765699 RepID=A0AAN4UT17_9RHOB|nr:hypothetical protein [Allgaiera indica]KDB04618.1 hypothetical protein U879_05715 [Defluviimonas sp. 20V17]GHE03740.1 hypothetical protein GCM10008024_28300 [Allgaiera indica]SDX73624.1 hypothetical protein SAMN05444006_1277 [Allgaiera indica]
MIPNAPPAPFAEAPLGWTESAVWIGTGFFDFHAPDPALIDLEAIARSLAAQPRWHGLPVRDYSVAEHSVAVWQMVRADLDDRHDCSPVRGLMLQAAALLHDAPEYILCDLPAPLKSLCPGYCGLHDILARAIEDRFGLPRGITSHPIIKAADGYAAASEKAALLSDAPGWPGMRDARPDGFGRQDNPNTAFLKVAYSLGLA